MTAVIYYSMSGNVEHTAKKIAELTGAELIKLEPRKAYRNKGLGKFVWGGKSAVMGEKPELLPYEFDAKLYDKIIFGFPVWASRITPPIRTFIEENSANLSGKEISAFACSSGGNASKALASLREALGIGCFKAELSLVDPKDKPSEENQNKIDDFISKLE